MTRGGRRLIKAIGGATRSVFVAPPQTISSPVTVPASVCVDVEADGSFAVAAGNGFIADAGQHNTWNWRSCGPVMQSGLVPPRMTTAERDASVISAPGTIIWNVTTGKLQVRTGGGWVDLH